MPKQIAADGTTPISGLIIPAGDKNAVIYNEVKIHIGAVSKGTLTIVLDNFESPVTPEEIDAFAREGRQPFAGNGMVVNISYLRKWLGKNNIPMEVTVVRSVGYRASHPTAKWS